MRNFALVVLAIGALLSPAIILADDVTRLLRTEKLASAERSDSGTVCTTAAPVTIADGDTGYVYLYGNPRIDRCEDFSSQVNIGSTTDTISVAITTDVIICNVVDHTYAVYGPADSDGGTDVTLTATGISAPFPLVSDTLGYKLRLKLVNNTGTGEAITVNWGVVSVK